MGKTGTDQYRIACLWVREISGRNLRLSEEFELEASAKIDAVAEACLQFTPQIAVRSGEAVFLEIGSCRTLYSEAGLKLRLLALCRRFDLKAEISFQDCASLALATAMVPQPGSDFERLPLQVLPCFWNPFRAPDPDLENDLWDLELSLDRLGIRNLGEFLEIPTANLASRFGKLGMEISRRIQNQVDPAWPGFRLPEKISEQTDTECEDLGALVFVLKGLVDRAMARLRGRGERAASVQVEVEFEKWSTLKEPKQAWKIDLPVAQGSVSGLLPIIQERLSFGLDQRGLPAPIQKLRFEILDTVPGAGSQRDFFDKKEEEDEAWDSVVGRLSHKLGKEHVFIAMPVDRYLPENAYTRTLDCQQVWRCAESFGESHPDRPTRLLPQPEAVQKQGAILIHGSKRWKIRNWIGPERLSGEWWKDPSNEGFYRDYYRVMTESGEQLWIFVDRSPQAVHPLYLHGYFD